MTRNYSPTSSATRTPNLRTLPSASLASTQSRIKLLTGLTPLASWNTALEMLTTHYASFHPSESQQMTLASRGSMRRLNCHLCGFSVIWNLQESPSIGVD